MPKVLIDTDIGSDVDDALALALAARSPELEIVGVTTVFGDVNLRARIARKILNITLRKDIPVFRGMSEPLLRQKKSLMFGHEGLGLIKPTESDLEANEGHAVDFIISEAMKQDLNVITLGCLTNLAMAIIWKPEIIGKIKSLVTMGGAFYPAADPEYDWNINCDPEAALVVLKSGIPVTLVPINVTMMPENKFTEEDLKYIQDTGTPLTEALSQQIRVWLEKKAELNRMLIRPREDICVWLHDPLTLMTLIDEKMVKIQTTRVKVEMANGALRTVADLKEGILMNVAYDADFKAFKKRLISRLTA